MLQKSNWGGVNNFPEVHKAPPGGSRNIPEAGRAFLRASRAFLRAWRAFCACWQQFGNPWPRIISHSRQHNRKTSEQIVEVIEPLSYFPYRQSGSQLLGQFKAELYGLEGGVVDFMIPIPASANNQNNLYLESIYK